MTSTTVTARPVGDNQFLFFAVTPQKANPYILYSPRDGKDEFRLRLVDQVVPEYPEDMRQNRTQGLVLFAAALTPVGKVDTSRAVLLECNHLSFCRAAADAVSQWRYDYTQVGSEPVIITVTARFVLR